MQDIVLGCSDNLHTCEVDMPFWPLFCESEAILSKKFRPGYPDCQKIFSPVQSRSRQSSQPTFTYEHSEMFTKDLVVCRDLANRASPVDRAHMKTGEENANESGERASGLCRKNTFCAG